MKRNKKAEERKDILRIQREWDDVHQAIWNQGWVELDEPYQRGWDAHYEVRDDLARSKFAYELQEILDLCGRSVWSRRKDFKRKDYVTNKWVVDKPYFRDITELEYMRLSPSAQKYFHRYEDWRYFHHRAYTCVIEPWKFVVVKTKHIVTHYREHDELLYQREAELRDLLYVKYYGKVWPGYKSLREWNRYQDKKEKGISKRMLRNTVVAYNSHVYDFEDDVYPDGRADNSWYYW